MTDADKKRRNSLLASLAFDEGSSTARRLRDDLETVHNIAVTLDRVRADLAVLADIGAIRTSGELRLSNYLLFQAAYAEFYFTDTLWPDFGPEELERALADYQGRQRRFGKTAEQVEKA